MTQFISFVTLALGLGTSVSMLVLRRDDLEPKFFRVNAILSAVFFVAAFSLGPSKYLGLLIMLSTFYAATVLWLPTGFERLTLICIFLIGSILFNPIQWQLFLSKWMSALVMGGALVAMNIGHWYLSAAKMSLRPLKTITGFLIVLLCIRALVLLWIFGKVFWLGGSSLFSGDPIKTVFVLIRVLFGVIGPLILSYMAWGTVKLGSTQSATGILYALISLVWVGETTSLYLMTGTALPI